MITDETSYFLSLFKRGRHCRIVFHADGASKEQVERERKERERFAVAAIAFVLKHDEDFRELFWRKICRQSADPGLNENVKITIEEKNWSDLRISCHKSYVVEFKIDAPLDDKQNPTSNKFFKDGGYGKELLAQQINRYAIVGWKEEFVWEEGRNFHGIACSKYSWKDLIRVFDQCQSKLVKDLFNCLASLGVSAFQYMKAKNISVKNGIGEVSQGLCVLQALLNDSGLRHNSDTWLHDGKWYLGFQVKEKKGSKSSGALMRLIRARPVFGWIGYQEGDDGAPERAIWLYCASTSERKNAERKIEPLKREGTVVVKDCGERSHLQITGVIGEHGPDLKWFEMCLSKLCS